MAPKVTNNPVTCVKDVDHHDFIKAMSAFLKKSGKVKIPEWVDLVKTSSAKELAPYDQDWYLIRCASVLRHMYIRSPIGVQSVTKIFGCRKRNGSTPSHFCRSSPSVARKVLQALELLKMVEQSPEGGRRLSNHGRRDMERIAAQLKKKPAH